MPQIIGVNLVTRMCYDINDILEFGSRNLLQGLFVRKEPKHLSQGISGELSSSLSIFELGWCLKLMVGVLNLKITLELLFGISTRECSRGEQFSSLIC